MVNNTGTARRHAARPAESKRAIKERNELLNKELHALRLSMNEGVKKISEETGKSIKWVQMQLYQGGKLMNKKRAVNRHNVAISQAAKKRREKGLPSLGKQTIAILSKEVAESEEWQDVPEEDMEEWTQDILDQREAKVTRVTDKTVGRDVQNTASILEAEVVGLHKRTGAEYLLLTLTHSVTDTYDARVLASNGVKIALESLCKKTPEEFALCLQAFINSGVTGAVQTMKENQTVSLKGAIRKAVNDGLHAILRNERHVSENSMPRMGWAQYGSLCATYGVRLEGWTGPDGVCNPGNLRGVAELQKLKNALDTRHCVWVLLTDDEWAMQKAAQDERTARRKRKGKAVAANIERDPMDIDEDAILNNLPGPQTFIFPPVVPPMPEFPFTPSKIDQRTIIVRVCTSNEERPVYTCYDALAGTDSRDISRVVKSAE
ncbi:hypothetical protein BC629DRAFT_1435612 [Irpex lacteus]|nr:hypothetical protein BC629DRAFT_1435612 [Irpex lacteus]